MTQKRNPSKLLIAALLGAHTLIAALTWRDLRARPADRVRGKKKLWRLASAFNTLGSVAYWLFGRRQAQ